MDAKIYSKDKTALILVDIQKPFFSDADSPIRKEFPKFKESVHIFQAAKDKYLNTERNEPFDKIEIEKRALWLAYRDFA